jgi:hypothetical protein
MAHAADVMLTATSPMNCRQTAISNLLHHSKGPK